MTTLADTKQKSKSSLRLVGILLAIWVMIVTSEYLWHIATIRPYPHPEQFEGKGQTSPEEVYGCPDSSHSVWACTKEEKMHQEWQLFPMGYVLGLGMPLITLIGIVSGESWKFLLFLWLPPFAFFVNPYVFVAFWFLVIRGIGRLRRRSRVESQAT